MAESAKGQSGELSNGLEWEQIGNAIEIYDYKGTGGAVSIPATISNLPVTSIGEYVFKYSPLTSITIPGTVTNIGEDAFFNCTNLPSVTIPPGVVSIGTGAFSSCWGLTNVMIPGSVASIGQIAFVYCFDLTEITVDATNSYYSSLNGVLFDKNQTTLIQCPAGIGGSYAVPDTVTSIGEEAFATCNGLTSVTIPGSVASIGENAFADCLSLTNACFEGNAPSDGGYIFSEDTALSVIYYVNGASGWGTNFENIPTLPCAQCGGLPPIIQITSQSTHSFTFSCSTITNQLYQIQSATNLVSGIWTNLGNPITATNSTMILSEPIATNMQQFYRVVLLP